MVTALRDWDVRDEERTSGIYAKAASVTTSELALGELRDITGDEPVAVLFFATDGRPPESAVYPLRPKRLEAGYSLTHRLSCWLHPFTRAAATEVPAYVSPWFPDDRVVVIPLATPDWVAGALVVTRSCAHQAAELRSLAADLALRLEADDRRSRINVLGLQAVGRR